MPTPSATPSPDAFCGIELRHCRAELWAVVLPDLSARAPRFKIQYFSRVCFGDHECGFDSASAAFTAAWAQG
jgi:hypothetical protein